MTNFSVLGDDNIINKSKSFESENSLYTFLYAYGPIFYFERFNKLANDVLFTSERDEQGMFGGLKIGVTKIDKSETGGYPTSEDCKQAFMNRYAATEDGTLMVLLSGCIFNGYDSKIDKPVRHLIEIIGNINHPNLKVRKSENIKTGEVDYRWNLYNADNGKEVVLKSVCKIGKEFIYNISRKDIEMTFSLINCISTDTEFGWELENILKCDNVSDACNSFRKRLFDSKEYKHIAERPINKLDEVKIKNSIINDILKDKEKCFAMTPTCVVKTITEMINENSKKKLSFGIIAKTSEDAINISEKIEKIYKSSNFTLICSYKQNDLMTNLSNKSIIYINEDTFKKISDMKFDYIIQNPPYDGSLHLDYFEWAYNIQKKNKSKMIIIQPASIYWDIRPVKDKRGNAWRVDSLKRMMDADSCVEKIIIENYNYDFQTNQQYPHSITFVDFSIKHVKTEYCCFGHTTYISSIVKEANQFGNTEIISRILEKFTNSFEDRMKNHVVTELTSLLDSSYFTKYSANILGGSGGGFAASYGKNIKWPVLNDIAKFDSIFGTYVNGYLAPNYHPTKNYISKHMIKSNKPNSGETGDKIMNLFGSKEELENWKWNSENNPLVLFMNIVYTIDSNNRTKNVMPWVVDKKYKTKEMFDLCHLTKEERQFVMFVLMKFRRDGAWFRRYLLGTSDGLINKLKNVVSLSKDKGMPDDIKKTLKVVTNEEVEAYVKQCVQEAIDYVEGRR